MQGFPDFITRLNYLLEKHLLGWKIKKKFGKQITTLNDKATSD